MAHLPVVDLSAPSCVKDIRAACLETGFFYVAGHGVPATVIDAMFASSKAFFEQPQAEKLKVLATAATLNRGYTQMGEETLDTSGAQKVGDTKEGYYAAREPTAGAEERIAMMGRNVWPAPGVVPGFQGTMERYTAEMQAAGTRVVQRIVEGMFGAGDPAGQREFMAAFERPVATLRLLHYKAQRSAPEEGVFACGAHSDYGMITLLAVAEGESGLEILTQGRWVAVPPKPGCFVVNIGDMLARWTNDCYRSTVHRVINTAGRERYSTAFFFDPAFPTVVAPLPQFCTAAQPAKYPPITSGEYLIAKYDETHGGFDSKDLKKSKL
eukprot:TRINITY_DN9478_c1_g1_i1.p1 TRINITY_DN9478_c1_g1~~TRINITY_DN9478_c1_g1_i1.p1  ORF type:complete len:325 (+),score=118.39 TRINITY_DN9478_c1_g1_i1:43-1017(+)